MKRLSFAFLGMLATGILVFNLSLKNDSNASNGVTLSNIQALQASAGETAKCDGSTSETCTITLGNVTATGTGKAVYTNN